MTEATSSRDPQRPHEKYMSILGHLEEMRSRIIRSLVAIVVGSIVSEYSSKEFSSLCPEGYPSWLGLARWNPISLT